MFDSIKERFADWSFARGSAKAALFVGKAAAALIIAKQPELAPIMAKVGVSFSIDPAMVETVVASLIAGGLKLGWDFFKRVVLRRQAAPGV